MLTPTQSVLQEAQQHVELAEAKARSACQQAKAAKEKAKQAKAEFKKARKAAKQAKKASKKAQREATLAQRTFDRLSRKFKAVKSIGNKIKEGVGQPTRRSRHAPQTLVVQQRPVSESGVPATAESVSAPQPNT